MMIIYALVDPRTNRIRYIGKSAYGLIRPLSHAKVTGNPAMKAWLYDMKVCGVGYVTIILAEASTTEQLTALEASWINTGARYAWPLCNIQGMPQGSVLDVANWPADAVVDPPEPMDPRKKWSAAAWRRDPEVRRVLAAAHPSTRPEKPSK